MNLLSFGHAARAELLLDLIVWRRTPEVFLLTRLASWNGDGASEEQLEALLPENESPQRVIQFLLSSGALSRQGSKFRLTSRGKKFQFEFERAHQLFAREKALFGHEPGLLELELPDTLRVAAAPGPSFLPLSSLGENLREVRVAAALSQKMLASRMREYGLRVSQNSISRIETGLGAPPAEILTSSWLAASGVSPEPTRFSEIHEYRSLVEWFVNLEKLASEALEPGELFELARTISDLSTRSVSDIRGARRVLAERMESRLTGQASHSEWTRL